MLQIGGPRFYRLFSAISFALILLTVFSLWQKDSSFRVALDQRFCSAAQKHEKAGISSTLPQVRRNVALATRFGYHHDVIFALSWTIERVMKGNGKLNVYAPSPLSWNFDDVVEELGLYHGAVKRDRDLIKDILDSPDGGIDMVILGTCEIECVVHFHSQIHDLFRPSHLVACVIGKTNC